MIVIVRHKSYDKQQKNNCSISTYLTAHKNFSQILVYLYRSLSVIITRLAFSGTENHEIKIFHYFTYDYYVRFAGTSLYTKGSLILKNNRISYNETLPWNTKISYNETIPWNNSPKLSYNKTLPRNNSIINTFVLYLIT